MTSAVAWLRYLWCLLRHDDRGCQRWLDEAYRSGRISARTYVRGLLRLRQAEDMEARRRMARYRREKAGAT